MGKLSNVKARKATIVFTSRCDARYLATLVNFWASVGENPRSASELVRLCTEAFAELLITNKRTEFVQTQEDAFEILERSGLMTKKMRSLNKKNLMDVMQAEDTSLDSLTQSVDPAASHKRTISKRPVAPDGPEHQAVLGEVERMLDEDLKSRTQEAQNNTEEFKKGLGMIPKGGE